MNRVVFLFDWLTEYVDEYGVVSLIDCLFDCMIVKLVG